LHTAVGAIKSTLKAKIDQIKRIVWHTKSVKNSAAARALGLSVPILYNIIASRYSIIWVAYYKVMSSVNRIINFQMRA